MVNNDRIVPIQRCDLLTMYATILNVTEAYGVTVKSGTNGVFAVVPGGGACICNEPVKKLNVTTAASGDKVYFVADYDFEGLQIEGDDFTREEAIKADACTLYCFQPYGSGSCDAVTP